MPKFAANPKFMKASESLPMKIALFVICKSYALFIAGYCLIPFAYLRFYKWWAVYKSMYFLGHIVVLPMLFVWKPLILNALNSFFPLDQKPSTDASADEKTAAEKSHPKSN